MPGYVHGATRGRRPSTGVTPASALIIHDADDDWLDYMAANLAANEAYAADQEVERVLAVNRGAEKRQAGLRRARAISTREMALESSHSRV